MQQDKVAIIVLTYNSISKLGRFFDRVIQSIVAQSYPNIEVIFVDNASSDGTPDYLETLVRDRRNYRVLRLRRNFGWSGGNNRGALLAKDAKYLFFMNDDIELLDKDCIRKLVDAMSKHRDLGAIQPLVINRDGSLNCGLDLGFSGFSRAIKQPRGYPLSEAFYAIGGALLTRSDAFFSVGMLDDDLFLYHDDVDYSWRLRLLGYKCACVVDTKAYHWGSATLGRRNPLIIYFIIRNNIWVTAKNSSLAWFLLRFFLIIIEVLKGYLGYVLLRWRDGKAALLMLRAILDGLINLKIAFSKRIYIMRSRKVKEEEINKIMNPMVDLVLIFPKPIRKVLRLK